MLLSTLTFVPLWRLVKEEHDAFCVIYLKLLLNRLVFLRTNNLRSDMCVRKHPYLHLVIAKLFGVRSRRPSATALSCGAALSTQAR